MHPKFLHDDGVGGKISPSKFNAMVENLTYGTLLLCLLQ